MSVASPRQIGRSHLRHITGVERTFGQDEIIVSKTDTKGRITYANRVFERVSGYSEQELIGKPHSIIRHPAMPRCVFRVLWDTVQAGNEIFAYVINRCRNGDHYWVLAHVTPTFGADGSIVGYHSNRRRPRRQAVKAIEPVYRQLCTVEAQHRHPHSACKASMPVLMDVLAKTGMAYDEFIFSLSPRDDADSRGVV